MEKIQSALEKARAARAIAQAADPSVPVPAPARGPSKGSAEVSAELGLDGAQAATDPVPEEVAAEWAALREVRIEPKALMRGHVVGATGGRDAGAVDMLRTKVLHQMRSQGWRRIGITSPGPACGKSTVAMNLAFGLARQADLRVVLIEADLRRPSIARTLGIRPPAGLSDLLEGRVGAGEALVRHRSNLGLLVNAGPRPNPAELFHAPESSAALATIERRFDPTLVIVDLPPVLIGDDVMAFAQHLDCALIVAAAGSTAIREIDSCERELASRTNIMGVVVNKCRYLDRDQGYGYGG